jgi:hypothetical protein
MCRLSESMRRADAPQSVNVIASLQLLRHHLTLRKS